MFIKKCLLISCLLSFLIACGNEKKVELKEEKLPEITIKQKTINNIKDNYQIFFDEYNNLTNNEEYEKLLARYQTLLYHLQQHIDEFKKQQLDQEEASKALIDPYYLLVKRTQHKRQWLINNHQGHGYLLFRTIMFVVNFSLFLCVLILKIKHNELPAINDRIDKRKSNVAISNDGIFLKISDHFFMLLMLFLHLFLLV